MIDVGLGHEYWEYATTMAAFIKNRTPTTSNKGTTSPFEAMWGQKPNLHNLPIFGCKLQVHISDTLREKLNPKTKDCIFLEYAKGVKGGVFEYVATSERFVLRETIIRSVRLNFKSIARLSPRYQGKIGTAKVSLEQLEEDRHELEFYSPITKENSTTFKEDDDEPLREWEETLARRPQQPLVWFMHEWALTMLIKIKLEPLTMAKALGLAYWREGVEKEYMPPVHNNTWEVVPLPPNKTIVSGKWCYQAKTNAGGTIQRHKARYVAWGFTQRLEINFMETTSPVAALMSLQAVLAIATEWDMELKKLDVNSAFLYGNLKKEIYLKQPEGF